MDITVYFARIDNFTMCTAAVKSVSRNARSPNGTRAADKKNDLLARVRAPFLLWLKCSNVYSTTIIALYSMAKSTQKKTQFEYFLRVLHVLYDKSLEKCNEFWSRT